jgi:hypothetical protein
MTLSMIVGLSSKSLKFALFSLSLYISLRLDLLFLCLLYPIIHQIVGLKKLYCLAVPVSKIRDMLQKFVVYMGHMQRYSSLTQPKKSQRGVHDYSDNYQDDLYYFLPSFRHGIVSCSVIFIWI